MSEQYALPKPTVWRLKDEDATEHYGKPIHVYYDGADLRLDHPDIEKMTALLEPLFTSEHVREAVLAEREACALVAESGFKFAHDGYQIADSIRARSAT